MKYLLLFLFTGVIFAQDVASEITSGLELGNIDFGTLPTHSERLEDFILKDGTRFSSHKIDHTIFKEIEYHYDQSNRLFKVNYYFDGYKSKKKYGDKVYGIVSTAFNQFPIDEGYYSFDHENYRAVLDIDINKKESDAHLTILKHSPIIKQRYDEFEKTTIFSVQNTPMYITTENNEEISIAFYGIEKDGFKTMFMQVGSYSAEWKFIRKIKFLKKNGDVTEIELKAERDVDNFIVHTKEKALVMIPKELAYEINNPLDVKIRVIGKLNYDFRLLNSQIKALKEMRKVIFD